MGERDDTTCKKRGFLSSFIMSERLCSSTDNFIYIQSRYNLQWPWQHRADYWFE